MSSRQEQVECFLIPKLKIHLMTLTSRSFATKKVKTL